MTQRPLLAEQLNLEPHPEGGWFRETWRSALSFRPPGYDGDRCAATAIYFLLCPGEVSAWHVVRSDELWLWHRGGPLELRLGAAPAAPGAPGASDEPGPAGIVVLGADVSEGQQPQFVVPGGTWQSAASAGREPVLVSCVVAPGFDFADFRLR